MNELPVFQPRRTGQAKSNAERQATFRQHHPEYNRRYKAKRRAMLLAMRAEQAAKTLQVQSDALQEALKALTAPVKPILMLPAPVQDPMMLELEALRTRLRAREEVKVAR